MLPFDEKYPGLFYPSDPFAPIKGTGEVGKLPWRIGLKFTGIKRSGYPRTDGTVVDPLFCGYPWHESLPPEFAGFRIAGLRDLNDGTVAFRTPNPYLVFFGIDSYLSSDVGGRVRPFYVAIPSTDAFPYPDDISKRLSLDTVDIATLAGVGKIASITKGCVIPTDHEDATLQSVGYRRFNDRFHPVVTQNSRTEFVFPGTSDTLPGVDFVDATYCYPSSFSSRDFLIKDPLLARAYDPIFEFVAPGTAFSRNRDPQGSGRGFSISIDLLPIDTLPILSFGGFYLLGDRDVFICHHSAKSLCPLTDMPPLKVLYGYPHGSKEKVLLTNDEAKIIPFRKVARDYAHVPKYVAFLAGVEKPLIGFYCLPEDVAKAPKLNKSSLKELRSKYPWVQKEHLGESEAKLAAHDRFLSIAGKGNGWVLVSGDAGDFFQGIIYKISLELFPDNPEVFARSPLVSGQLYYKAPSADCIRSNPEFHYSFLKAVRDSNPKAASLLFDPDVVSILLSGDIAV